MSFLHRQRSLGNHGISSSSFPPIPFPQAIESPFVPQSETSISSRGHRTSGGGIIRRVSTLLSGKKKRQMFATPLSLKAPPESSRWTIINELESPTDSEVSFDDIRRPSGLGRAASISSNRSLPPSPFTMGGKPPHQMAIKARYERIRAISSPNAVVPLANGPTKFSAHPGSDAQYVGLLYPPLPMEVLTVILSFVPRSTVASLATVSSEFCAAARVILYETLDLRMLRPSQVELLVTVLAYRHDLSELVRAFECHSWPKFFPPQNNYDGPQVQPSSFSPALTAIFTIAFQNMHRITSLVLPSFDQTFLRHHNAFGLQKITFLNYSMSASETRHIFAWLDGQTNITHLSFPNLLDAVNMSESNTHDVVKIARFHLSNDSALTTDTVNVHDTLFLTPSGSPNASAIFLPPTTPSTPFKSISLLPALTNLVATPSIVSSLVDTRPNTLPRPLDNVTLTINNTLYTGLRPVSLLGSLHGISTLVLKFTAAVDRRTIGKVLGAGGALCAFSDTEDGVVDTATVDRGKILRRLEVELADANAGAAQALYKAITSTIPRYQGVVELYTRITPDIRSETNQWTDPVVLSDREADHVAAWVKYCPSLQAVQLLSGARWTCPP